MDWPHSILLYILLLVAIAAGYFLGRRERHPKKAQSAVIKDYYQGLNFLLGDRPELGVDRFIQAMEVSDESIDVHLALAGVVRRRGEVEKAIRIHQNLLASPALKAANKQLIEFELARDYHAAGLLDRAEALLVDIVSRRDSQEKQAAELLLDIYEQERDWQQAIEIGRRFAGSDTPLKARLSHFYCELGQGYLAQSEIKLALESVRSAIQMDGSNPRGHWLAAEVEYAQKHHRQVLRYLARVVELQPDLGIEVLDLYARASESLGQESAFLDFLVEGIQRSADAKMLQATIEHRRKHGLKTDYKEILDLIARQPRSEHFSILLDMLNRGSQLAEDGGISRSEFEAEVRRLLAQIAIETQGHQCHNCGFTSHHHIWHCPTCKRWGSFSTPASLSA
ncbi:MAG: hypothetical protein GKR90_14475 [Pseudomonadales bacterium]|nr:hypothetical protein [Pseudomonadales bacterium]